MRSPREALGVRGAQSEDPSVMRDHKSHKPPVSEEGLKEGETRLDDTHKVFNNNKNNHPYLSHGFSARGSPQRTDPHGGFSRGFYT